MSTPETGVLRHQFPNGYTIAPNEATWATISNAALGLYVRLRSLPEGTPLSARSLARVLPGSGYGTGRDALQRQKRELTGAGLIEQTRARNGDGSWRTDTIVFERPQIDKIRSGYSSVDPVGIRPGSPEPENPAEVEDPGGKPGQGDLFAVDLASQADALAAIRAGRASITGTARTDDVES